MRKVVNICMHTVCTYMFALRTLETSINEILTCKIIMNIHFRLVLNLHSVLEHGKVVFFFF
jgi:hypothetical protein